MFERALAVQDLWACHLHTRRMARLRVTANLTHDLQVDVEGEGPEDLPKLHVKLLYPAAHAAAVAPLIKFDPRVRAQGLKPFLSPAARHHVKNKSLFVLMKDHDVVVFTLLEGEVVRVSSAISAATTSPSTSRAACPWCCCGTVSTTCATSGGAAI